MLNRPSKADKRSKARQKTALPAVIATLNGQPSFDCVITELSAMGAKVAIPDSAQLPKQFLLINVPYRIVHEAKLIWRSNHTIGVTCHTALKVGSALPASWRFLNRLWLERASR